MIFAIPLRPLRSLPMFRSRSSRTSWGMRPWHSLSTRMPMLFRLLTVTQWTSSPSSLTTEISTFGWKTGNQNNKDPDQKISGQDLYEWWRGQDLNLRPSGYEPDELPDCSTPRL